MVMAGLGVSRPWERSRWFFALGGGADIGYLWQRALGQESYAFAFNINAHALIGLRLFRGLGATLDIEPGLLFPRTEDGLGVRPNLNTFLGLRYEL
jgi:hypothetical protein